MTDFFEAPEAATEWLDSNVNSLHNNSTAWKLTILLATAFCMPSAAERSLPSFMSAIAHSCQHVSESTSAAPQWRPLRRNMQFSYLHKYLCMNCWSLMDFRLWFLLFWFYNFFQPTITLVASLLSLTLHALANPYKLCHLWQSHSWTLYPSLWIFTTCVLPSPCFSLTTEGLFVVLILQFNYGSYFILEC